MKHFLLTLCALAVAPSLWASSPWGVIGDFEYISAQAEQAAQDGQEKTAPYAIVPFWHGQPMRIMVFPHPQNDTQKEQLRDLFAQTYQAWLTNAANVIEAAGRAEEFKDILPFLKTPVKIEIVNQMRQADLFVFEPAAQEKPTSRSTYTRVEYKRPTVLLDTPLATVSRNDLIHEFGHSLGLDDQYEGRLNLAHPVYSSTKAQDSMMKDQRKGFTCDDADGIINLIDVTRKQFHGGEKGWKSLCPKSKDVYINAIPAEKGPYLIQISPENYFAKRIFTVVRNGKIELQKTLSFDKNISFSPFEPLKYKTQEFGFGGIVKGKTKNNETVYVMHTHDLEWTILLKDGKLIFEQQLIKIPHNQRVQITYAQNGKLYFLKKQQDEYSRTVSLVLLGDVGRSDEEGAFVLEMVVDRKGNVLHEKWKGDVSALVPSNATNADGLQGNVQNALLEQTKDNLRATLIKHANDFPR